MKLYEQDSTNQSKTKKTGRKAFCKLTPQGLVKKTFKVMDTVNDIDGKHDITRDIANKPQEKHTKAEEIKQSAIIVYIPETKTENVFFENQSG